MIFKYCIAYTWRWITGAFKEQLLILRGLKDESSTLYSYEYLLEQVMMTLLGKRNKLFFTPVKTKKQWCEGCMAPKGSLHCSNQTKHFLSITFFTLELISKWSMFNVESFFLSLFLGTPWTTYITWRPSLLVTRLPFQTWNISRVLVDYLFPHDALPFAPYCT